MKKEQLRKIIKEEIQKVLSEMPVGGLNMLVGKETLVGKSRELFKETLLNLVRKIAENLKPNDQLPPERKVDLTLEAGDIIFGFVPTRGHLQTDDVVPSLEVAIEHISILHRALQDAAEEHDEVGLTGITASLHRLLKDEAAQGAKVFNTFEIDDGLAISHYDIKANSPIDLAVLQEALIFAYQEALTPSAPMSQRMRDQDDPVRSKPLRDGGL